MPSRYEPCGLTQMIALRYGTLPIVRRTGGLADTVRDGETGFIFDDPTTTALHSALARWINATKAYEAMRRRAMTTTYSWTSTAEQYIRLYNEVHERE